MAYSSERSDPTGHGLVLGGKFAQRPRDDRASPVGVVGHHLDHGGDVDCAMLLVPTVIIGDHGDRRVGDFRFARQFRLCRAGHPDDVGAVRLEAERLRQRGELWALDAN